MTGSRIRRQFDQGRLGLLASAPGIDSRTWIVIARVDDDADAVRWADEQDGPLGWLVDVTVQGGPLDQEPIDGCRVASAFAGADRGRFDPVERGALVVVALSEGGTNAEPTIVGVLPTDGAAPPAEVNGEALDEELAKATHVLVTPHAIEYQAGGDVRVKSDGVARWLGQDVELAELNASEPYVLGNKLKNALEAFAQSVQTAATQLVPPGPPVTPVTAAQASAALGTITVAVGQLTVDLERALSQRIRGE